jgi:hypothetical protein
MAGLVPAIHAKLPRSLRQIVIEIAPIRIHVEDEVDLQARGQCFIFLSRWIASRMSS